MTLDFALEALNELCPKPVRNPPFDGIYRSSDVPGQSECISRLFFEAKQIAGGEQPALEVGQSARSSRMRISSAGVLVTRPPTPRSISRSICCGSSTVQA